MLYEPTVFADNTLEPTPVLKSPLFTDNDSEPNDVIDSEPDDVFDSGASDMMDFGSNGENAHVFKNKPKRSQREKQWSVVALIDGNSPRQNL